MNGPKSLEVMMILADLSAHGIGMASSQLAKICLSCYGGSNRAYLNLLRRLEKSGHITVETENASGNTQWVPRLTTSGKSIAAPLSPIAAWETPWDQKWRLLTFDLPSHASRARFQLRNWLKSLRFGKLQGSVWLSHRSLIEIESSFAALNLSPDFVVCIEGTFWNARDNSSYVEKAWPIDRVQAAYSDYLSFLDTTTDTDKTLQAYQSWRVHDQTLWNAAIKIDPFLPEALWPTKRIGANLALESETRRRLTQKNWLESAANW